MACSVWLLLTGVSLRHLMLLHIRLSNDSITRFNTTGVLTRINQCRETLNLHIVVDCNHFSKNWISLSRLDVIVSRNRTRLYFAAFDVATSDKRLNSPRTNIVEYLLIFLKSLKYPRNTLIKLGSIFSSRFDSLRLSAIPCWAFSYRKMLFCVFFSRNYIVLGYFQSDQHEFFSWHSVEQFYDRQYARVYLSRVRS